MGTFKSDGVVTVLQNPHGFTDTRVYIKKHMNSFASIPENEGSLVAGFTDVRPPTKLMEEYLTNPVLLLPAFQHILPFALRNL